MEKTKVCVWLDSDLHTYLNESRGEELTIPQYIRLILKQKMKSAKKRKHGEAVPMDLYGFKTITPDLIPDDLILMPGVIDTTTNFVEHQNLVVQRLKNFTNIVGNERVIGSSDCGFGTFAGFGTIDPDIAYEKLKVLAEGAAKV